MKARGNWSIFCHRQVVVSAWCVRMHACMHVFAWMDCPCCCPCSHHFGRTTIISIVSFCYTIPSHISSTHTHTHTRIFISNYFVVASPFYYLLPNRMIIIIIIIIILSCFFSSSRNTTSAHVSPEDPTQDIPLSSMVPSTNSISYPREYWMKRPCVWLAMVSWYICPRF